MWLTTHTSVILTKEKNQDHKIIGLMKGKGTDPENVIFNSSSYVPWTIISHYSLKVLTFHVLKEGWDFGIRLSFWVTLPWSQ